MCRRRFSWIPWTAKLRKINDLRSEKALSTNPRSFACVPTSSPHPFQASHQVAKMPRHAHQSASESFALNRPGAQRQRAGCPKHQVHQNSALDMDRRRGGALRSPGGGPWWTPSPAGPPEGPCGPRRGPGSAPRAPDDLATVARRAHHSGVSDASRASVAGAIAPLAGAPGAARRADPAAAGRPGRPCLCLCVCLCVEQRVDLVASPGAGVLQRLHLVRDRARIRQQMLPAGQDPGGRCS